MSINPTPAAENIQRPRPIGSENHPAGRRRGLAALAGVVAVVLMPAAVGTSAAQARPGGDHDERVCPAGYRLVVAHCERISNGGPGRRAI